MKKILRLFVLAFLIASAGFLLAGCSRNTDCQDKNDNAALAGNADPGTFSAGGSLIRELGEEPATLNPVIATDVYEGIINGGIYETLIRRDNETLEFQAPSRQIMGSFRGPAFLYLSPEKRREMARRHSVYRR